MLHETTIRLSFFFGIMVLMCLWEVFAPRRSLTLTRSLRWPSNLSLVVVNTLLMRFLIPTTATGVALFAVAKGWGVFNAIETPRLLAIVLSVIALDGIIYMQHVMFHAVPVLWRVHRVHHADLDLDVTSGNRFHPIEIIISMGVKFISILLLGVPATAVLIFEVLLNGAAMFNHANARLPLKFDRLLRLFLVTPDMHRVHHSTEHDETDSNFGFNLPWWDRLFGTYRAQPRAGHSGMTIGLSAMRDPRRCSMLQHLLSLPFRRTSSASPPAHEK
ncbi:MAG: sterol desaturase family protein [Verrucomicrobia bacterium]|nr:sterol desaturase family protein [Verrucomicrobiota bacterium]